MKSLSTLLCLLGCMQCIHTSQSTREFDVTIENGFQAEKIFTLPGHKVSKRSVPAPREVEIPVKYQADSVKVRMMRGAHVEPVQVQRIRRYVIPLAAEASPSLEHLHLHLAATHRAKRATADIVHQQTPGWYSLYSV